MAWILLSPLSIISSLPIDIAQLVSFTNSDLVGSNFTYNHPGNQYPVIEVYNNNNEIVIPTGVTYITSTSTTIDLSGFTPISGTWHLKLI